MRKVVDFQKPQIEPQDLRSFHRLSVPFSAPNLSENPNHRRHRAASQRFDHVTTGPSGTSFATGWGWACSPRNVMKIVSAVAEWPCGSGEIDATHGAIEAVQLFDPERAQLSE